MTDGEKGTTPETGATDPSSGKMPDARKRIAAKVKFLDLCTMKCVAAIQQYRTSRTEKVMKQIDWTYMKVQEQKKEIKVILAELRELSPEESAAYVQQETAIDTKFDSLNRFMDASWKLIGLERCKDTYAAELKD